MNIWLSFLKGSLMNKITTLISLFLILMASKAFSQSPLRTIKTPLEIITLGHPTLLLQAEELNESEVQNDKFQIFIDDMIKTMKKAGGVGLAAPQVNISKRLFVIKPSFRSKAEVFINPILEYLDAAGKKMSTEGCLSIPGKQFTVERYKEIHIRYEDRNGKMISEKADGFRAIVIQHEFDHLNGILISDIFSQNLDLEDYLGKLAPRM